MYECTGRAIALPPTSELVEAGSVWTRFKVLCSSFYVMGKALSGKLSCMRTGLVCYYISAQVVIDDITFG